MSFTSFRGLAALLVCLGMAGRTLADEPVLLKAPQVSEAESKPAADELAGAVEQTPVIDETAQPEIIRERYPNRAVRIERQVVQDVQQNYINHGPWAWWDEKGQLLARGEYYHGKQHGKWTRIHYVDKGTIFALPLYRGFERPFVSEATFEHGKLEGAWTVYDAKKRKVSQWMFENDQQHGSATWWQPNGQVLRTANYKNGVIDGELREYNARGEVAVKETYLEGFKLDLERHSPKNGQRVERSVLIPVAREHYDWFTATVAVERVQQVKIYHGPSTWWYSNGQKEAVGHFERGVPHGEFIWWHSNGQERSRGEYVDGKQQGKWTWWHANGQKEMEGQYERGQRVGKWAAWAEDGKVRLVEEHPEAGEVPVVASDILDKQASR